MFIELMFLKHGQEINNLSMKWCKHYKLCKYIHISLGQNNIDRDWNEGWLMSGCSLLPNGFHGFFLARYIFYYCYLSGCQTRNFCQQLFIDILERDINSCCCWCYKFTYIWNKIIIKYNKILCIVKLQMWGWFKKKMHTVL